MRPAREASPKSGLASSVLWIWKREDATRIEIARRARHFSAKRGMTEPKLTSTGQRWKADSTPRAARHLLFQSQFKTGTRPKSQSQFRTENAVRFRDRPRNLCPQGPRRQQLYPTPMLRHLFALGVEWAPGETPGPKLRLASPTGATPSSSPRLRWNCPGWSDHT